MICAHPQTHSPRKSPKSKNPKDFLVLHRFQHISSSSPPLPPFYPIDSKSHTCFSTGHHQLDFRTAWFQELDANWGSALLTGQRMWSLTKDLFQYNSLYPRRVNRILIFAFPPWLVMQNAATHGRGRTQFNTSLFKMWSVDQQRGHPWKLVRDADSPGQLQTIWIRNSFNEIPGDFCAG